MATNCTYGTPSCRVCGEEVTSNGLGRRAHLRGHWMEVFPHAGPLPIRRYGGLSRNKWSNSEVEWMLTEEMQHRMRTRMGMRAVLT